MPEVNFSIFDAIAIAALTLATRAGGRSGFAKAIWPLAATALTLLLGTLAWPSFGQQIGTTTGLPPNASAVLAYALVATAILTTVFTLQKFLGKPLLLLIPPGPLDGTLGALAGTLTASAAVVVCFALLSPFDTGAIDWSPISMSNDQAVSELGRAVFGTVRRSAFDDSWIGRTLQENAAAFMIHPGANPTPGPDDYQVPL